MKVKCKVCEKEFNQNWQLERHKKRKNKCKPPVLNENDNENLKQQISNINLELQQTKKEVEANQESNISQIKQCYSEIQKLQDTESKIECIYCKKTFNFNTNLQKHLKVCKQKNDNVSIYERELGIEVIEQELTCRFCDKSFRNKSSLSKHKTRGCIEKVKYEVKLEQRVLANRKDAAAQIVNNTTNNTTNNNTNIVINLPPLRAFGNENHDYITTKTLLAELEHCKNFLDMSGIIGNFTKLVYANPAHPENHNVLINSLHSGSAKIYNGKEFEEKGSIDVQDTILKSIGTLVTQKCDEYGIEEDKKQRTIPKRIHNRLERTREVIDEDLLGKLDDLEAGTQTKLLTSYRTGVKNVLHTSKNEITSTQQLIE